MTPVGGSPVNDDAAVLVFGFTHDAQPEVAGDENAVREDEGELQVLEIGLKLCSERGVPVGIRATRGRKATVFILAANIAVGVGGERPGGAVMFEDNVTVPSADVGEVGRRRIRVVLVKLSAIGREGVHKVNAEVFFPTCRYKIHRSGRRP